METARDVIVMVDDDITNLNVARNNLADKYITGGADIIGRTS